MQVAVIGSGTMGNGIAHVFAQHGFAVSLLYTFKILKNGLDAPEAASPKSCMFHKISQILR